MINPASEIPSYCKNCTHKAVCDIQENIKNMDKSVEKFKTDNATFLQTVTSINYTCRYKTNEN